MPDLLVPPPSTLPQKHVENDEEPEFPRLQRTQSRRDRYPFPRRESPEETYEQGVERLREQSGRRLQVINGAAPPNKQDGPAESHKQAFRRLRLQTGRAMQVTIGRRSSTANQGGGPDNLNVLGRPG